MKTKNIALIVMVMLFVGLIGQKTIAQTGGWGTFSDPDDPTAAVSLTNNIFGTNQSAYLVNINTDGSLVTGTVYLKKDYPTTTTGSGISFWLRSGNDNISNWDVMISSNGGADWQNSSSLSRLVNTSGVNLEMTYTFDPPVSFNCIALVCEYDFSDGGKPIQIGFNEIRANGVLIDSYSDGTTPLPVELSSFTGKASLKGVELNWTTATEVNNYEFAIERKCEDNWSKIGRIPGNGNSNSPKSYYFIDKNTAGGTYRLKQIDCDGKFKYSSELQIKSITCSNLILNSYPNPFNPSTTVSFAVPVTGQVNISVFNSLGQKVAELFNGNMKTGEIKEVKLEGKNLTSGTYFVRLSTENGQITKKVMLLK